MHRTNPSPPPREIELKLEWIDGTVLDLLAHPLLRQAEPAPDRSGPMRTTYYDTPDLALRRAGLSLRIRERDGRFVQTLKAEGRASGLALDRDEWEWPLSEPLLDLGATATTPLARLLADPETVRSLRPVFTLEADRRVFELSCEDALVEISLDLARVVTGTQAAPFAEIELELKRGDVPALFHLARDFAKSAPLRLSLLTKSERGYRLLPDPDAEDAVRAAPIAVPPQWSSQEAFQAIARACLVQIVRNEEIVRRSRAPEALHQMRVGTRRLKAAIAFFADLLDDRESQAAMKDLRWIGKRLGRVRDIDVYADTLRASAHPPDRDALEKAEKERRRAYEALLEALEKPRFRGAILRLAAWVEAGRWRTRRKAYMREARAVAVSDRARKELKQRWKRVRKASKKIAGMGDGRRHRLRIRIRELRYGTEFFAATFPGRKAARRHRSMLSLFQHLQDALGELNDLAVAKELFPDRAEDKRSEARRERLLSRAEGFGRRLRKSKAFWSRKAVEPESPALNNAVRAQIRSP